MRPDRLGVIGLGALGGSVAWQARRGGVPWISGYSRSRRDGVAAAKAGAVTHLRMTAEEVAGEVDLLVLAAPPAANLQLLERLAASIRGRDLLVTDVASVKRPIVGAAERLGVSDRFAGSHPLRGTHRCGFGGARPDLLAGGVVYVTPCGDDRAAREVADWWETLFDASAVVIDAGVHDELLAWTSHLPQAVASALALALARGAARGVTYGQGALDTTRLAASDPGMWAEVFSANREPLLDALGRLEDALGGLREALESGDAARLTGWLEEARAFRAGLDR